MLKGWIERDALQSPGLEHLFKQLSQSTFNIHEVMLESSQISLQWKDNKINSSLLWDGQSFISEGQGSIKNGELDIQLTTQGDIDALLKNYHSHALFFSGVYQLETSIKGRFLTPLMENRLAIKDGSFENLSTGAFLEGIEGMLFINENDVSLETIHGKDRQKGQFSGKGAMELTNDYPYSLEFDLHNINLIKLDHVKGELSGKINIQGNSHQSNIEGHLMIDAMDIALDETKPTPKTLDIIYTNVTEPFKQKTKQPSLKFPITLNLLINSNDTISITDKNFSSQWKSSLLIKGTQQEPLVYGFLEMTQGTYQISGKTIHIKEGKILFDGNPLKNSSLFIVGSIDTNTIIAEVVVSGPLANPSLSLRSTPPLPQQDILSHLIFGCGLADISPQQSKHLKTSIKELQSFSTGTNVVDHIRQKFGIDRIEINRGSNQDLDDVSLQIGKYLMKGLYIAFNKGITSDSNRITLEASLKPYLKLQAEFSDTKEGQLNLKWRYDY